MSHKCVTRLRPSMVLETRCVAFTLFRKRHRREPEPKTGREEEKEERLSSFLLKSSCVFAVLTKLIFHCKTSPERADFFLCFGELLSSSSFTMCIYFYADKASNNNKWVSALIRVPSVSMSCELGSALKAHSLAQSFIRSLTH